MRATRAVVGLVVVVSLVAACSGSLAEPEPPAATPWSSPPAASPTADRLASASPATEGAVLSEAVANLERGVRARGGSRLQVWRRPSRGSASRTIPARNPLRQPLVFLATDEKAGEWFRILLPRRPNGSEAWVPTSAVRVVRLHDRLEVDLSEYTLTRFTDGRRVARYRVGVGQPQWPTPAGTFYVWAQVPQPSPAGPYGAYALGLSGFSPVLTDWPGGGRFAIHGTTNRWDTGRRISHGCIRVFNRDVMRLRDVAMGTPVIVAK